GDIVGHIGGSRLYFARAYRGEGWITELPGADAVDQRTWLPWLRSSAERFTALVRDTPDEWLTRRVQMLDTPGTLSGRPILMWKPEHEVHHRSQIDTYAGLQGWPVPDIFGRSYESVAARQADQRARHQG